MKKIFFLLSVALCCCNVNAEDNYPDDDVAPPSKTVNDDEKVQTASYYGLGFYSYDGMENYSLSFGAYNFNGFGLGMNLRSNFKFKDHQNTYNADLVINYSMGVYKNEDVMVLLTPEVGPSFASRTIYEDGKAKDKFYVDGFVGIKATVVYKILVLSAGYHIWAPKWKFGKDEKADGFYAQLGVNI